MDDTSANDNLPPRTGRELIERAITIGNLTARPVAARLCNATSHDVADITDAFLDGFLTVLLVLDPDITNEDLFEYFKLSTETDNAP